MPPQVVQYPQPTSSTAHSSRAADVEGGQRFNLFGNVQPDREDSTRSEGVDSSRSGVRLTTTRIFMNAGAKKPLATSTGDGRARATQKSHIISHGHIWRPPTNVAMTTMRIHDMKEPQPNYVQHSSHTGAEASAWPARPAGPAGPGRGAGGRWRDLVGQRADAPAHPAPLVWRAPEGPEGTGGLRGAAPNKVRTPSLAGGRGLRRPEHPWGHKQQLAARAGRRPRAHRAVRPTGQHVRRPEHQRRRKHHRKVRTPRSTPGSGRPGDRRGGRAR